MLAQPAAPKIKASHASQFHENTRAMTRTSMPTDATNDSVVIKRMDEMITAYHYTSFNSGDDAMAERQVYV